jgi:KaiC/GvpD/RAD55 family RecA-like ATPase
MGITLVFCSYCGTKNLDNARYCCNCDELLNVRTKNLDDELADLSWKLRRTLSKTKLSDHKWLNRIMSKKLTNDEARVERLKYLIERVEYSKNNPTKPIGIQELDDILYGGIPSGYSVLLTSPPLDEKDLIVDSYLQQGLFKEETVLQITSSIKDISRSFVLNYPDNFYIMLCSPWAESIIEDTQNLAKIPGIEDLTQLNISLNVFIRDIKQRGKNIDRVVIDLLSDTLLMHETRVVRRWLMDLLTLFKQLKVTSLSTLDQGMHSASEARIIIDLFDGHMDITENRLERSTKKILNIKRLYNKKYQKKDLELRAR